jgi:hypothetical protein
MSDKRAKERIHKYGKEHYWKELLPRSIRRMGKTSRRRFGKTLLIVKGRWNYPKSYQQANVNSRAECLVSVEGVFVKFVLVTWNNKGVSSRFPYG